MGPTGGHLGPKISGLIEIRSLTPTLEHGGFGIRNGGTIIDCEEHARCVPGIVDTNKYGRQ